MSQSAWEADSGRCKVAKMQVLGKNHGAPSVYIDGRQVRPSDRNFVDLDMTTTSTVLLRQY